MSDPRSGSPLSADAQLRIDDSARLTCLLTTRTFQEGDAQVLELAEAGKPDPHGGAGDPGPAHRDRVGAFGVDPAAPFSPAGKHTGHTE